MTRSFLMRQDDLSDLAQPAEPANTFEVELRRGPVGASLLHVLPVPTAHVLSPHPAREAVRVLSPAMHGCLRLERAALVALVAASLVNSPQHAASCRCPPSCCAHLLAGFPYNREPQGWTLPQGP